MRISDWSSDVCSSDLIGPLEHRAVRHKGAAGMRFFPFGDEVAAIGALAGHGGIFGIVGRRRQEIRAPAAKDEVEARSDLALAPLARDVDTTFGLRLRGEVAVGFPVAPRP